VTVKSDSYLHGKYWNVDSTVGEKIFFSVERDAVGRFNACTGVISA